MRPRRAHVRIVPIGACVVRVPEHGPPIVGVFLTRDDALPRCFTPAAWLGAAGRAWDCYLFQRFAK